MPYFPIYLFLNLIHWTYKQTRFLTGQGKLKNKERKVEPRTEHWRENVDTL